MHIAIDAQLLNTDRGYRSAGVSNYSRQLLAELGRLALAGPTAIDLTAYVSTPSFEAPGVQIVYTGRLFQHPAARALWEQMWLPRQVQADRADLVHGLVNVLPLATGTPGVVTVHDLSFLHMPDKFLPAKRAYLARLCAASSRQARQVIAVSRQTADDLVACFQVPASKIHVIHNGVAPRFQPAHPASVEDFRRRSGLPARYLLYLGTLEPRKNLVRLVRAFAAWRSAATLAGQDIKLVIAGAKGWYYDEIFGEVRRQQLDGHVLFPGYVADNLLVLAREASLDREDIVRIVGNGFRLAWLDEPDRRAYLERLEVWVAAH